MKIQVLLKSIISLLMMISFQVLFAQNYQSAHPYSDPKLLQDFLCSEVVYPEQALNQGIEGKVVLSFIVEKDGSVSQVRVQEKVVPELDAEALRLFRMLLWEPAVSLGQPVASENEFPINFNIKKYNKHCKTRGYITSEYPFAPVDTSNNVYDYSLVDKKPYPVFDEKNMKLETFIAKNIKYPETAYRQNLSGKVSLRFVVELQGRVSNIKVLSPVGGGCTQEAIRLLQLIRWMPGIKNQVAVRTFMNLDIQFNLPEDSDMNMFENGQMNAN
jgi:TonB family protein